MSVKETDGVAVTGSYEPHSSARLSAAERPVLSTPSPSGGIGKWVGVAILAIVVGLIAWGIVTGNLS